MLRFYVRGCPSANRLMSFARPAAPPPPRAQIMLDTACRFREALLVAALMAAVGSLGLQLLQALDKYIDTNA